MQSAEFVAERPASGDVQWLEHATPVIRCILYRALIVRDRFVTARRRFALVACRPVYYEECHASSPTRHACLSRDSRRPGGRASLMREPEFGLALVVAPLAAPLTVVLASAVCALMRPRPGTEGINPVVGIVFLAVILVVYGAPLAYAATLVILWPIAAVLRGARAFTWWGLTVVATIAGGILFPLYLHALAPSATWDFFPGVGLAAGAATGWTFWFVAVAGWKRPGHPQ